MVRIRCRVDTIISTISDIEDHQNDSQGAGEETENSSESSDSESDILSTSSIIDHGLISDWIMTFETYEVLRPQLPMWRGLYKVIVDLDDGCLHIRVVPGDIHAAASSAFNYSIESWANNLQYVPPGTISRLRNRGDASRSSPFSLWLMQVDYRYNDRASKSPDNSFVPRDIQVPPAKLKLGMNIPYPTIVIEVGHNHEGWNKLKGDARMKAFSRMTSIQIIIGIQIFISDFRVFWARRSATGTGMNIQQTTPKLDVQVSTNLTFTLPKNLVFWSVPQSNWPVTPTPNLILQIDTLRLAIADLF